MTEVTSEVVNDLASTFEEFKKTYDEKLENLEQGTPDPLLDEKLAKLEAKLDSQEDLNQQMTLQAKSQEQIGDRLDALETVMKRPQAGIETQDVDRAMKAFDMLLRKGKEGCDPEELKALTVSNDTTVGFLAPPEYIRDLIKAVTEISPLRSVSRIRSTGQRSIQIPKRTGQFTAQWTAEVGTRSETTGYRVGMEEIPTHELYALVDISNQMLEDSVFDLESEMQQEFATQFAKGEGKGFIDGTSINQPEGILTNGDVGETVSGHASTLLADGLISLVHAVKSEYGQNGTFVFNRSTLADIRKLKDTAGQYVFQAGMMLTAGVPNTILGQPYVEATDMPDVAANAYPIVFGDFNQAYTIVDRVGLSVQRDNFTQATAGNVRYVARRRVGGQVVLAEAIRKQKVSA